MISVVIMSYLPILYLLVYSLKVPSKGQLARTSTVFTFLFVVVMILSIGLSPEDISNDKPRYTDMYYSTLKYGLSYEYRDPGWIIYNILCTSFLGKSVVCFFLLTATIYMGNHYLAGKSFFPKEYVGYFIVMTAGCLGFSNYGVNVIRAGVALSLLMVAFSLNIKVIFKILLVIISLSFQISMAIPVAAYLGGRYIKKTWMVVSFWAVCLLLSAVNFDLTSLFETIGFVDERVEQYANSVDKTSGSYEKGFRLDFLLYSVVPLLVSFYYIAIKKIKDANYMIFVRAYLLANAVWLLAIRMAYSDRFAYLSWYLIPLLTLYPVINYQGKFGHPRRLLLLIMYTFVGVCLILSLRSKT